MKRPIPIASSSRLDYGVKSGRSGTLKLGKLGLSCKANKCGDAGTGDLGVLTTHETLAELLVMPRVITATSINK